MPIRTAAGLWIGGLIALALAYDTEADLWILVFMLLAGLGTTTLYRPGVVEVLRRERWPTAAEIGLIVVNGVAGFLLVGAVQLLLSPPIPLAPSDPDDLRRLAEWPVFIAGLSLPPLPGLVQIARNFAVRERVAPVWPAVVGMAGGGLAALATVVLIRPSISSLLIAPLHDPDRLMTPAGLAAGGLLFGLGAISWRRALCSGDAPRFDGAGSFRQGLVFAIVFLGFGVAACTHLVLHLPRRGTTDALDEGLIWAGALTAGLGLIWIITLFRLRRAAAAPIARSVLATILLTGALAGTLLPVSTLATAGDWAGLALIFYVPLTVVMALIVAVPAPWLLKRVLAGSDARLGPSAPWTAGSTPDSPGPNP